jgi:lysophospholipase L1-like esterase
LARASVVIRRVLVVARAVAGVVVGLLVSAVLVEALIYHPTGKYMNPDLGLTYRAGIHVHGSEGFSWSRFAEDGIRVPLLGDPPEGGLKVLCLGDSYTEAFQLPYGRTYPAMLETLLEPDPATPVSCLNAGTSGGSPAKYLATAAYYTERFEPDIVVIQLVETDFSGDLFDRGFPFFLTRGPSGFELETGPWAQDPEVRASAKQNQHARFTFGDGVRWVHKDIAAKRAAAAGVSTAIASGEPEPPSGAEDVAEVVDWTVSALADAYECPVVVVYIPKLLYPDVTLREDPAETALRESCARVGVTMISMRAAYVERFWADGTPSHGFANTTPGIGHINATGHTLVAEELARVITERGLAR